MHKKIRPDDGTIMIYWEPQVAGLCGQHCVNTLLQFPAVSAADLAEIAQGLDAKERVAMAEQGVESADFIKFLGEDSGNVAGDGNFSVQVLSEALSVWNLEVVSVTSPDAKEAKQNPLAQNAFILNLGSHWFSVRKIGGVFWNLNSLNKGGPEEISDFYLALLFDTLMQEGYSIFVVFGDLPVHHDSMMNDSFSSGGGEWRACRPKRAGGGGGGGGGGRALHNTSADELQKAIQASMADLGDDGDDDELAAAIAASLSNVSAPSASVGPSASNAATTNADAETRALALSRVLSEPEPENGVMLQIRLRDGATLRRSFRPDATLQTVFDFVIGSSATANLNGVLREGSVKYESSQKTLSECFGGSKRVALVYE